MQLRREVLLCSFCTKVTNWCSRDLPTAFFHCSTHDLQGGKPNFAGWGFCIFLQHGSRWSLALMVWYQKSTKQWISFSLSNCHYYDYINHTIKIMCGLCSMNLKISTFQILKAHISASQRPTFYLDTLKSIGMILKKLENFDILNKSKLF